MILLLYTAMLKIKSILYSVDKEGDGCIKLVIYSNFMLAMAGLTSAGKTFRQEGVFCLNIISMRVYTHPHWLLLENYRA